MWTLTLCFMPKLAQGSKGVKLQFWLTGKVGCAWIGAWRFAWCGVHGVAWMVYLFLGPCSDNLQQTDRQTAGEGRDGGRTPIFDKRITSTEHQQGQHINMVKTLVLMSKYYCHTVDTLKRTSASNPIENSFSKQTIDKFYILDQPPC